MDPLTVLAIAKFVTESIREGLPVAEAAIRLINTHGDAEAKAMLPELESAYAASRQAAQAAFDQSQA